MSFRSPASAMSPKLLRREEAREINRIADAYPADSAAPPLRPTPRSSKPEVVAYFLERLAAATPDDALLARFAQQAAGALAENGEVVIPDLLAKAEILWRLANMNEPEQAAVAVTCIDQIADCIGLASDWRSFATPSTAADRAAFIRALDAGVLASIRQMGASRGRQSTARAVRILRKFRDWHSAQHLVGLQRSRCKVTLLPPRAAAVTAYPFVPNAPPTSALLLTSPRARVGLRASYGGALTV